MAAENQIYFLQYHKTTLKVMCRIKFTILPSTSRTWSVLRRIKLLNSSHAILCNAPFDLNLRFSAHTFSQNFPLCYRSIMVRCVAPGGQINENIFFLIFWNWGVECIDMTSSCASLGNFTNESFERNRALKNFSPATPLTLLVKKKILYIITFCVAKNAVQKA